MINRLLGFCALRFTEQGAQNFPVTATSTHKLPLLS